MKKRKTPLPVDPADGTKVYMPLGKRFSPGEELCGIEFEDRTAENAVTDQN